ncbi:diacylglycerol kinase family protein [Candidatus Margulisiibacteriota bacterium]
MLHKRSILQSFYYAARGMVFTFQSERSMIFHTIMAIIAVIAAFVFKLDVMEWMVLTLSILLVFIAETINTAIEINVDMVTKKKRPRAMMAKDVAAAAVLISAINAIIIGIILFWPKVFS